MPRQSMQELSSLDRSSVRVLGLFLLATNFCSRGSETERSLEERGTEVKSGQENEREKLQRSQGRGEGRSKLLDRWLCAAQRKTGNLWLLTGRMILGGEDRGEATLGYRRAIRVLPSSLPSRFLLPLFLLSDKKESLTASDNLASRSSPRCPVARPHTDCPGVMTRLFLR